jgi:hypothetical protein
LARYGSAAEDFERPSRERGSPMAVTGVRFYASGTSELVRGCGASEGVVLALVLWRRERTPALADTDQPKHC